MRLAGIRHAYSIINLIIKANNMTYKVSSTPVQKRGLWTVKLEDPNSNGSFCITTHLKDIEEGLVTGLVSEGPENYIDNCLVLCNYYTERIPSKDINGLFDEVERTKPIDQWIIGDRITEITRQKTK